MKDEISPVVVEMPEWKQLALLASSLTQISALHDVFAGEEERKVYAAAVNAIWRCSVPGGDVDRERELHLEILKIWPYCDGEDDEDDDFDLYTPVYWKIEVIQAMYNSLYYLRLGDSREAAIFGVCMCLDVIDAISQNVTREIAPEVFTEYSDPGNPFIRTEKDSIRRDIDMLTSREVADPGETVQRVRDAAVEGAANLSAGLARFVVLANQWSTEDLREAQGVQRA
ncbi:hypothetical protein [Nocardiopsis gilva]|uniref:hypothetical protein n=1 Tax=Nocardiopsis gilva TaxID=280236 RepID=UPI001269610B|nr:hypothetical protein [Nocardiopsis gilva]